MDTTIVHSPPVPQHATSDEDVPIDVRRAAAGEVILWTAPIRSRVRPMVSLGQFADGTPAIHCRAYRVSASGVASMLKGGCSFRVSELVEVVERVRALLAAVPSLRGEAR